MFPFVEVFGIKLYLTGIGIVVAFLTFIMSSYISSKRYNQSFSKIFLWLPLPIILMYILWLYFSFVLKGGNFFPHGIETFIQLFSPYGYHFNLIGVLLGFFLAIWIFMKGVKRKESKKIWFDIFFQAFINAVIVLWLFLLLGDNFLGRAHEGWMSVKSMHLESKLNKYNGVYPLGIFLSLGALLLNILITLFKIIKKRTGIGILGFALFNLLLLVLLPFWNTPRHIVIAISGNISLDLYSYVLILFMFIFGLYYRKMQKNY